jgi:ligand-binding SRPBCC domain-containing protein
MRYADGPSVDVEIRIDAPPSRVWTFVSDIDLPARFSEEFQGAEWLDDATEPAAGARFRGTNRHQAVGEWQTTSTLVAFEPERLFAWAVGDTTVPSASWRYELEPDGDGSFLRYGCVLGPGPSGLSAAIERIPDKEERIIERRCEEHRANMQRVLHGIKALAEAED